MSGKDKSAATYFLDQMRPALERLPKGALGVAVSGGGDSVALAVLLGQWCRSNGRQLAGVTVDHGLRAESAGEAETVAALCADLGLEHTTLRWQGWEGRGNLQNAARTARYTLMGEWAREKGIAAVAVGHTLDDQAETYLMRLQRGSGVDGLAAMSSQTTLFDLRIFRPMLSIRRHELRTYLTANGHSWIEDPSNSDKRFDRVKVRQALAQLEALGIRPEELARTALRMRRAREALEQTVLDLARDCAIPGPLGDVMLDGTEFAAAPLEIRLRLLSASLNWVSGARYRPRLSALMPVARSITDPDASTAFTLHGCVVRQQRGKILVRREPARVEGRKPLGETPWDGKWLVREVPPEREGFEIGPLGEIGLEQVPGWRDSGFDRELLVASPALWRGSDLVSHLAQPNDGAPAMYPKGGSDGFFDALVAR